MGMTSARVTRPSVRASAAAACFALVLTGCGAERAGDGSSGPGAATPVAPSASATAEATPSVAAGTDQADSALGTVVLNTHLAVRPEEYPLPDVPTHVEATSVADLRAAYAVVPGIDEVLAELDGLVLGPAERLFAYTVHACRTDQVELVLRGSEVPMIVSGTAALRCAPPTTLVVWVVGDEIPPDARPAQAVQK